MLHQFFEEDLTKFIKLQVKNIHRYVICLLIERNMLNWKYV